MSSQSRHVYSREERTILEASFSRQTHPDIHEKERLAKLLNCNIIQISNWFQNHRRRYKKQQKATTSSTTTAANTTTASSPINQVSYTPYQPTYPYNMNGDGSSHCYYYYYYHHHPPMPQCTYSNESMYTASAYFDPFVTYEQ